MTLNFYILTVSDRSSRGERPDASGPALKAEVEAQGWNVVEMGIVPDEKDQIQQRLIEWCRSGKVHIILTTGGTGFSPRDVTPEATLAVVERLTPGLTEAMRAESLKITPHAMLSRSAAGILGQTLIINFPGSPKAAVENFRVVLPVLAHAVQLLLNSPDAEAGHRAASPS